MIRCMRCGVKLHGLPPIPKGVKGFSVCGDCAPLVIIEKKLPPQVIIDEYPEYEALAIEAEDHEFLVKLGIKPG